MGSQAGQAVRPGDIGANRGQTDGGRDLEAVQRKLTDQRVLARLGDDRDWTGFQVYVRLVGAWFAGVAIVTARRHIQAEVERRVISFRRNDQVDALIGLCSIWTIQIGGLIFGYGLLLKTSEGVING